MYLCIRHLVISVLISLDPELSENVWFVWSKPSYTLEITGGVTEGRSPDGCTDDKGIRKQLGLAIKYHLVSYSIAARA